MAKTGIESLLEELNSEDRERRLGAAIKLSELGDERGVDTFIERFENPTKEDLFSEMIDGLWTKTRKYCFVDMIGKIGGEKAKNYIFDLVRKGADWLMVSPALTHLYKRYGKEVSDFLFQQIIQGTSSARHTAIDCVNHSSGSRIKIYTGLDKRLKAIVEDTKSPENVVNDLKKEWWEICYNR